MNYDIPTSEIDELLFRCLEGTADDAECERGWRWISQSLEHEAYYGKIRDVWIASELFKPVDAVRQRQAWSRLEKKMKPGKVRGKIIRMELLKWAAAAAIVIFVYVLGTKTSTRQQGMEIVAGTYNIEAPKGGKSLMTLSDGSKVWLNAGSSLNFDNSFGLTNRSLILQGEAYFEVTHDEQRPFLVETPGVTVTALGTAFNIKAYPDDEQIEITLVEGLVRVETNAFSKTQTHPVVLEPNQKVVFHKALQTMAEQTNDAGDADILNSESALQSFTKVELSTNVDVEASISWKDKRWIVQSERLGTFATIIERKYDVELIFEDPELENYRISATLEEETIEQLLNAIRLTVPMDYRIERNKVYLKINWQLKIRYDRLIQNK